MAANQSARHQKRSRGSDAAEKVSRMGDERTKRRRTSDGSETQKVPLVKSPSASQKVSNSETSSQAVGKQKDPAPWSFSRPVGGRYSNLDPVMTVDES